MSASIFLEYDCEQISAAMSVALLQFKNATEGLTLAKIGKQCEREAQSISQYCNGTHEIPSSREGFCEVSAAGGKGETKAY